MSNIETSTNVLNINDQKELANLEIQIVNVFRN